MAITERTTTTSRPITTSRTTVETTETSDAASSLLIVLGVLVALAAAYFLYDYYAAPRDNDMVSPMASSEATVPASNPSVVNQPVEQPATTTVPADQQ